MEKTLAEASTVTPLSSHSYMAEIPEEWCIGSVPHGGFTTAMFLKVTEAHFRGTLSSQNQPHTIALHLDFLRRTQTGKAFFTVKDTKLGRQASVINVTLTQDNREEVVGYITQGNMETESGISFSTGYDLHPPVLPVDLTKLKNNGEDEHWARQPDMPFAEFRKATTKTFFHFPKKGQAEKRLADEWVRLANGENWTNSGIGYVCDMWPMPVESFLYDTDPYDVSKKGTIDEPPSRSWYPTVLLNIDFKKVLPAEGVEWLFVRVAAKAIKNGRMDLEIIIMDAEGDIVALSHHVSLAVSASRNIAQRGAKI
ncbi:thioesterase-like superfamily-domain-containing protein [Calycina marina]|uniref:Thioesterase-like superfamily-domain-containing protein n=1 Tax=Calycina marina TaxID=1763456 RepID=A0A9P8CJ50_9HELO|nr:thioesterase-like superfamily-domain-containing protein [Calycina marina]